MGPTQDPTSTVASIALVGARGHVGLELLRLLLHHPRMRIGYLGSRKFEGQTLRQALPELAPHLEAARAAGCCDPSLDSLRFAAPTPADVAQQNSVATVLALPNQLSEPYVQAIAERAASQCIIDLSADHRFVDDWQYGLVEVRRESLRGARRIANPGCYATAAQLAITPLLPHLAGPPRIFGVSGYSGAGTNPSPRNDPNQLRDNLMPYSLVNHTHEREISRQLGHAVHFMPHVASFFRGISLTIDLPLNQAIGEQELHQQLLDHYADEPLVNVTEQAPLVRDAVGHPHVTIGGIRCSGKRAVLVATIDNLLKGAASQCLQNLNLALGFAERMGLDGNHVGATAP